MYAEIPHRTITLNDKNYIQNSRHRTLAVLLRILIMQPKPLMIKHLYLSNAVANLNEFCINKRSCINRVFCTCTTMINKHENANSLRGCLCAYLC